MRLAPLTNSPRTNRCHRHQQLLSIFENQFLCIGLSAPAKSMLYPANRGSSELSHARKVISNCVHIHCFRGLFSMIEGSVSLNAYFFVRCGIDLAPTEGLSKVEGEWMSLFFSIACANSTTKTDFVIRITLVWSLLFWRMNLERWMLVSPVAGDRELLLENWVSKGACIPWNDILMNSITFSLW